MQGRCARRIIVILHSINCIVTIQLVRSSIIHLRYGLHKTLRTMSALPHDTSVRKSAARQHSPLTWAHALSSGAAAAHKPACVVSDSNVIHSHVARTPVPMRRPAIESIVAASPIPAATSSNLSTRRSTRRAMHAMSQKSPRSHAGSLRVRNASPRIRASNFQLPRCSCKRIAQRCELCSDTAQMRTTLYGNLWPLHFEAEREACRAAATIKKLIPYARTYARRHRIHEERMNVRGTKRCRTVALSSSANLRAADEILRRHRKRICKTPARDASTYAQPQRSVTLQRIHDVAATVKSLVTSVCEAFPAGKHVSAKVTRAPKRRGTANKLLKTPGTLPRYVLTGLRKLLKRACAQRRGYSKYPRDVVRMCTDEVLFQEVISSDWNKKEHSTCSSAVNTYRDRVLKLSRLRNTAAMRSP